MPDGRLGPLGLAKDVAQTDGPAVTMSDAMMGTPAYMSPEQVQDSKNVDCRADLYSLGATLYAMLAGQPPFQASTVQDLVDKIRLDVPERLPAVHRDLPALTEDRVVERAVHPVAVEERDVAVLASHKRSDALVDAQDLRGVDLLMRQVIHDGKFVELTYKVTDNIGCAVSANSATVTVNINGRPVANNVSATTPTNATPCSRARASSSRSCPTRSPRAPRSAPGGS